MADATLGKFVLDFEARIASLETDLGRAQRLAEQSARAMQRSFEDGFKRTEDAIRGSMERIAGIVGVGFSVEGIAEWTKASFEAAQKAEDLAQSIGASTKTIQTLSYTAGVSGASLDLMSGSLNKIEKSANDAAHGNVQALAAFNAIGISATQVAQLLKNPDQLLQVVTQHLAQFADGSGKTAVVMQLAGRGAAENIPLINKLGESYADLRKRAEEVGIVMNDADTQSLARVQERFNELDQDAKGLANRFAVGLAPTIEDLADRFEKWLESDAVKNGVSLLATNVANVAEAAAGLPGEIEQIDQHFRSWQGSLGDTNTDLGALLEKLQQFTHYQAGAPLTVQWNEPSWLKWLDTPTAGSALAEKQQRAMMQAFQPPQGSVDALKQDLSDIAGGFLGAITGADDFGTHLRDSGKAADEATKPQINYNSQVKDLTQKLASAQVEAAKFLNSVSGIGADQYTKALEDYNTKLDVADQIFNKLVDSGATAEDAINFIADATQRAKEGFDALVQAERNKNDVDAILSLSFAKAENDLNEQIRLLGLDENAREKDALATKLITSALGDMKNFMGPLTKEQQDQIDGLTALAHRYVDVSTAVKNNQAAAKDWINVWTQAGDGFIQLSDRVLFEGESLFNGLKDLAKTTTEAIVNYFERLAIINPILNAVFGGSAGFNLLPTLGSAAVGASGGAGGASAGGATAAGNSGLFGTAQGGISLFNAGKTMFSGFQSAYTNFMYGNGQGFGSSVFGSYESLAGNNVFTPSAFGWGASVAGGVYAGYNRYQNRYNTASGIAGGAAYGLGTTALGLGLGGVATGAGFSAGVGALGALGPVGWVALIAMGIDMLSGGKLFGTSGKVVGGNQTVSIGAGGASVDTNITTKGQKPLFGGSYWKEHNVATDPAVQEAWDEFFAGVTTGLKNYATQYGAKIPGIIASSFQQAFDKHGNVTGSTTSIAGHTYSGESAQQYQQRVVDESELSVLDQFDSKLDATIDKYRANVDVLTGLVSGLSQAELMMKSGEQFLALGTDQSLSALINLAAGTMQFGETIDQALARIEQAQAAYDQFVGQFKTVNYVDDFEAAMVGIKNSLVANIKQANDLAKAAGAAGASAKDLSNIYAFAAKQEADAMRQLEASAQSLAFQMGLTTVGSLSDVSSEIQRLEQQRDTVVPALHQVGDALQGVAQRAIAAMNLLLGSDSPYNDLQKLAIARQGLIHGTVTSQQYDDIARRLFGSSNRYFQEFQFAQQFAGRDASNLTAGAGGGGHKQGLSGSDSQRLQDLLKEQQQLQAAADYTNAQTLAQQIAEIAQFKGIDYKQVASDMHLDLAGFEKRLHMSDDQFAKYIKDIEAQKDSNGDNTKSIVQAIYDIGNQITVALGGTPTDHTDPNATGGQDTGHSGHATPGHAPHPGAPPPPPGGHSGHGTPPPHGVTREGATMIGNAVARAQSRPGGSNQRQRVRIA